MNRNLGHHTVLRQVAPHPVEEVVTVVEAPQVEAPVVVLVVVEVAQVTEDKSYRKTKI